MRIVINDYLGHAPQVQLSRALAARGHDVLHLYSADVQTPKSDLSRHPGDPLNLTIEGLSVGHSKPATSFFAQRFQDSKFGGIVARRITDFRPDVVMACNNPLDVQRRVQSASVRANAPFIYWLQQFCAVEIDQMLTDRSAVFETLVGSYYHGLERKLLQRSAAIVPISDDILAILATQWNVYERQCMVVHNWAPLDFVTPGAKDNPWAGRAGFAGKKIVLYTGVLGRMEDSMVLVHLAERLQDRTDVHVVVVSGGPGATQIAEQAKSKGLLNFSVLPFQPYEIYSDVLAAADVLFAMVREDAAVLFVPSKVTSYFCASRPIVLAAPWHNVAALSVQESGGGRVVAPGNISEISEAVLAYLDDPELSRETGTRGRSYAERTFEISSITDRFERLFERLQSGASRRRPGN